MSTSLRCCNGHTWNAGAAAPQNCPICGLTIAEPAVPPHEDAATIPPSAVPSATITLAPQPAAEAKTMPESAALVPGYVIERELGRGGMGVVYQARHLKLNRLVALKMILAGGHAGAAELERFRAEAEAIARLQHPNIVQVYEVGEQRAGDVSPSMPYFALEFCDGGTLAHQLAGTPLPPRQAAALAETLAHAMQVAHDKGIIHRDLKPANILLVSGGCEPPVGTSPSGAAAKTGGSHPPLASYTPKITDFGLAKKLDGEPGLTATGAVMGTPSYMAPEQAGGKGKEIGPACDVYALGAILYECLTGRPPFKAATPLDTIMQVMSEEPVPPRQLNAKVPADVETICLKCLHKEPARRYASAGELANELRRFQAGEPIFARPVGRIERLGKWVQRNPGIALSAAAVTVTLALGIAVSSYFAIDARAKAADLEEANVETTTANRNLVNANAKLAQSEKDARGSAEAATKARDDTQDQLATTTMMLARSRFEDNQAGYANALLEQVPTKLRRAGWGLLKNYVAGSLFTLRRHVLAHATSVVFSPDGRLMASANWDSTVTLWDARTGQELRTLRGHTQPATSVAFTADGQALASTCGYIQDELGLEKAGEIILWNARTGVELRRLHGHGRIVGSVVFGADGRMMASASDDGTIKLWDVRTGQELRTLRGHTRRVNNVAFTVDGRVLASASDDGTLKLWDTETGQELRTLRAHAQSVAFSADGQVLASASGNEVKLWGVRTGQELPSLPEHAQSVAFSADGQVLASASGNEIKLWDARTRQLLRTLRGHTDTVRNMAFSVDGQVLATASFDHTVKLWDTRPGTELRTMRGHTGDVTSVAFAAGGLVLASAGGFGDNTVKLWEARTGQEIRTLTGHFLPVQSVAFTAVGKTLASASVDGTVRLWKATTGKELLVLSEPIRRPMSKVAFAANGQVLAWAGVVGAATLWDLRANQVQHILRGANDKLAFSADSRLLASGIRAAAGIKLWDTQTGREVCTLPGHKGHVTGVAFAAKGYALASASDDGTITLWDARTGVEVRRLHGHRRSVTSVVFAADGPLLASASADGMIKLWDARTGQELRALRGHTHEVLSVAFTPDGEVLASASYDGTIKLWDTRTGEDPEKERRFRLWATAPDSHLHRHLAEQADKDKQPFAVAFRLGRYLAAKSYYAANPKDEVKPPFAAPTFPDGIACTGVLYQDSGIAPARLLIGTARALAGEPTNWLNHAFHGGALYRNGEHAKALAALTEAIKLHGKPSPFTYNLLGLTHLAMGQKDKGKVWFKKAPPAKDALWEDAYLQRLLQPEIAAALARPSAKHEPKKR